VHDREGHGGHRAFTHAVTAVKIRGAAMYFLSKDCHVCNAQGYWIILNVSRDKYLCVTHADLMSIGSRIHGWQHRDGDAENCQHLGAECDTLIGSLLAKGVLTGNSDEGKAFVESENAVSEAAVSLPAPIGAAKVSLFCVARFFSACAKIDWCLRKGKLALELARISRRRLRAGSSTKFLEDSNAIRLITAFKDLRPLYPRPHLCLFDSLALLEFLAGHHGYPRIVFGVIADPFQAHCWLQEGNVLLNDDLERVGKYKPILSV
jgi:Transglutaminase-like superfamily